MRSAIEDVATALAKHGLLLVQDKQLPNVVSMITGETLSGSWWSHARGGEIFRVLSALEAHPDVLFVKLVKKKVTLVHRTLWPALLAVVSKPQPWQLDGLSTNARQLLARIDEAKDPVLGSGPAVKELELRLLAHTAEVHTESGKHAMALQSWSRWAREHKVKPLRSTAAGRRELEQAVEQLGAPRSALPRVGP